MTTPDKAAEIICRGIKRGKARILVGPDAYVFDVLARVAPTRYYDVMATFEKRLRLPSPAGQRAAALSGLRSDEGRKRLKSAPEANEMTEREGAQ